jgi:hypothetical protein
LRDRKGWKVKKAILGIVIGVVAIAAIFTVLLMVPSKPKFELLNWDVVANGALSIEFVYSTDKAVEVVLIDPSGREVGYVWLSAEASRNSIRMAPYGTTPIPGIYRMIVKYQGERIAEEQFRFVGARILVGKVSLDWDENRTRHYNLTREYYLKRISIEIVNDGDLPAFVNSIRAMIDGEEISAIVGKEVMRKPVEGWIEPGRHPISWEGPFRPNVAAGTHTLTIVVSINVPQHGVVEVKDSRSITVP